MNNNKKTIRIKLEKVSENGAAEVSYVVLEMTNAIMLDARHFGFAADVRVGDILPEATAQQLASSQRIEVKVVL